METSNQATSESRSNGKGRVFGHSPAVRTMVPVLCGLFGPSGSGKTYSALRLATGIQRVSGGEIFVLDTEADRALHYAPKPGESADPERGKFAFQHVPFSAPFSPIDYLQAIAYCLEQGARTIIIDSMSHEHEGPGGVLEWHQAEVDRMSGGDERKAERVKMGAWGAPKAARRRLINTILQLKLNAIFCFRAKEKLKIVTGKPPEQLGWMPIAGEEFLYEMTVNALLYPGSKGVPTWQPEFPGEKQMLKLPRQFHMLFADPVPLNEEIGEHLAQWAKGDSTDHFAENERAIRDAASMSDLEAIVPQLQKVKERRLIAPDEYNALRRQYSARKKELAVGEATADRMPGEEG